MGGNTRGTTWSDGGENPWIIVVAGRVDCFVVVHFRFRQTVAAARFPFFATFNEFS